MPQPPKTRATSTFDRMNRPSLFSRLRRTCAVRFLAAAAVFGALTCPADGEDIVWNFGAADPGTAAPIASPANLSVSNVTQGNNNGTTLMLTAGSAGSANYPGASQGQNAQLAAGTGTYDPATSGYFEVTLTPSANYRVILAGVNFGSRRTNTGPVNYSVRTSADTYATPIAGGAHAAASSWGLMTNAGLNVISSAPLTIRIFGVDGAGNANASQANWRIDDLKISALLVEDGTPEPTISDVSPLSGTVGTAVTVTGTNFGAAPAVRFNGTLAAGSTVNPLGTSISTTVPAGATTGTVTVTAPGGVAGSGSPFTVPFGPDFSIDHFGKCGQPCGQRNRFRGHRSRQ